MTDGPLVLVDATAVPADRGGVGRYVDNVVARLPGRVAVAIRSDDPEPPSGGIEVIRIPGIASTARRLIWEQTGLPRLARRLGADVIFSPHYTMPLATRLPVVVTFHDATFFSDPGVHTPLKRRFFRTWIALSGRRARSIVVPSAATAHELHRYAGLTRAFEVIPHGVDRGRFHPPSADETAAAEALLEAQAGGWIAFLGTIEPRKNVPALIAAYGLLVRRLSAAGTEPPLLVLAGGAGWERSLDEDIAAVPSPGRVHRAGYVDAGLLPGLLGDAAVVVYPSLGEGFGLPVLEAMACGSAVLTTPLLALPEVGGDAVAYCDPDPASIADGLGALLADPTRRAELGSAGARRAAGFTWQASAAAHRRTFDAAVN